MPPRQPPIDRDHCSGPGPADDNDAGFSPDRPLGLNNIVPGCAFVRRHPDAGLPLGEVTVSEEWRPTTIPIDCAECPLRQHASLTPVLQSGLELIQKARWGARVLPPRTQISTEGEPSGEVFTLFAGWAFRYKLLRDGRRQILDFRLPGDFLGFGGEHSDTLDHSVESITVVALCVFRKSRLLTAVQSSPAVANLFREIMRSEERVAFEHLVDIGRRNATEAVSHLLLELWMRQRRGEASMECGCEFPITQEILADALGLTAVHVNRVLRRLREAGLVSITNRALIIHDIDRIAGLCEFNRDYSAPPPLI
jgi:CRP-like cAMP-binding protein